MMVRVNARFLVGGVDLMGLVNGNVLIVDGEEQRVYDVRKRLNGIYELTCLRESRSENGMRFIRISEYVAQEKNLKQGKLTQVTWLNSRELEIPDKSIIAKLFMGLNEKEELERIKRERNEFDTYHNFLEGYKRK